MPCPRCGLQWLEVGPEGGRCKKHGWVNRAEIDDGAAPVLQGEPTALPLRRAVVQRLSDVMREEVQWLWDSRIARGKITILEGDPEVGKSYLALAITTAVTRGLALPGDVAHDAGGVLILTAEDGLGDTIRPRAEDMGANLKRIFCLTATVDDNGTEKHFSLVDDLEALEREIIGNKVSLVIIDPINAYLGGSIDTNRDAALRSVLTPLASLAERHSVAIIAIRHLTKGSRERAIYRGQGNIAYVAAARSVLLLGKNPNDDSERVVVCTKNNLAAHPTGIAFEIVEGQFRWKGETSLTAEDLLRSDGEGGRSAFSEATDFLREALANGARPSKDVEKEARSLGISAPTLKRARAAMRIGATRLGEVGTRGGGVWLWRLPEAGDGDLEDQPDLEDQEEHPKNLSSLMSDESENQLPTPPVDPLNQDLAACCDCSEPTLAGAVRCARCIAATSKLTQLAIGLGAELLQVSPA